MSLRTVLLQSQRIISAIFLACSWLWSNPTAATDIDDYLRQFHEDEIQEVLVGETPMPFFEFSPSSTTLICRFVKNCVNQFSIGPLMPYCSIL